MDAKMNELDEQLQDRLALLEAGESLTTAWEGLPEETAIALTLAAELREMALPEPDETAVVAQRAAVIRAAQQQALTQSNTASAPTDWLSAFWAWWRGHQVVAWSAAAVATILLLFVVGRLLNKDVETIPTVVEQEEETSAESGESDGSSLLDRLFGEAEEDTEAPVEDAPGTTEVAVAPEAEPGFQSYLPLLSEPLAVGPQTAVLGDLQGVVSVQQPDGSWSQVSTLSSVAAGSRVRTGELSKASLTFYDGSVAKLGPDSEISVDTLDALRPEEGFRTVVLTQWRGDSTHDVQFRNDGGSRYEVKSPSGTGVARGTTFLVTVLPDQTSRYTVLKGRVDVTSINVTVVVLAGQLSTIGVSLPPSAPVFQVSGEGEVTAVGETWTIGGQIFATDDQTIIVGNPQVGDWVTVQGHLLDDGTKVADQIVLVREVSQNSFALTAVVTEMGAHQWQLGDLVVLLDEATVVDPAIELGDWVRVTGVVQVDGSLLARQIYRVTPDSAPFEFTGVVQTIGEESWLISGIVVTVNGRTEIKNDPAVGDVVRVEGQITPDGTWLAREIKAEEDEAATFEFTGVVETIEPWQVAGIALAVDEWTEIDTAVVPGALVKVEGVILADGTWLAEEIKLVDDLEDGETLIRFMGIVASIDPWLVNGLPLLITDSSRLDEGITVGMLVQVLARLTEDGRWEIVWIRPLLPPTTGCFTIHSQVITINGSQIVLANWPTLTLDDGVVVDGDLVANSLIAINICFGDDGTIVVVNIIVIQIIIDNPPSGDNGDDDHDDDGDSNDGNRVTICHKGNTLTISESGLNGHLGHGDTLGACGQGDDDDDDD